MLSVQSCNYPSIFNESPILDYDPSIYNQMGSLAEVDTLMTGEHIHGLGMIIAKLEHFIPKSF